MRRSLRQTTFSFGLFATLVAAVANIGGLGCGPLQLELSARLVIRGVAAPDHDLPEGGRVLACIRKDAVRIFRPRAGEEAAGVIVEASFLGSGEACIVDIAGVRIETAGQVSGLAKGDKVHVSMMPDEWVFVR